MGSSSAAIILASPSKINLEALSVAKSNAHSKKMRTISDSNSRPPLRGSSIAPQISNTDSHSQWTHLKKSFNGTHTSKLSTSAKNTQKNSSITNSFTNSFSKHPHSSSQSRLTPSTSATNNLSGKSLASTKLTEPSNSSFAHVPEIYPTQLHTLSSSSFIPASIQQKIDRSCINASASLSTRNSGTRVRSCEGGWVRPGLMREVEDRERQAALKRGAWIRYPSKWIPQVERDTECRGLGVGASHEIMGGSASGKKYVFEASKPKRVQNNPHIRIEKIGLEVKHDHQPHEAHNSHHRLDVIKVHRHDDQLKPRELSGHLNNQRLAKSERAQQRSRQQFLKKLHDGSPGQVKIQNWVKDQSMRVSSGVEYENDCGAESVVSTNSC